MKTLIVFLLLSSTNFTLAKPLGLEVYRASLASASFQDYSILFHDQLKRGDVSINLGQRKAGLGLVLSSDCPSGAFCDAVTHEWKIELPLRSVHTNSCGVKIFKASTLLGSMSTVYQELLIADYSSYRCRERKTDFATEIEFKQIDFSPSTPNSIQQSLSLKASELRLTF